ncbi:type IV secretion system protein [Fusobacterium sp. PH5-44]|uniref:type IV secretion system protein n=1 Tax=unclassified Fusobacterium TaxID=2648384 RepID=UPI003D208729
MSILSTTMENFVSALKGMPAAIKPAAMGLLGALTIIDLLWSYFKEVLEIDWIKYLVRKALSVGLIMYIINDYENIVNSVLKGFTKLGALAVPSSGASSYIDNPSLLMTKITNIGVSMWNASSGLKEGFLAVALLAPLIIVGAILCFQIIVSYIEFYFMTGFALIFVPLGAIGVGQQYFSNVFKALIGCAVKIATIQIILGLAEAALTSATTVSKFDFQASIVLILTYAIVTYIILKVPSMASSLLTGSPAMNGNDVAKLLAGAAKTAGMVGAAAVAGAVTGGMNGTKSGESVGGKIGKGTFGAISGAIAGAGNEMKHNIFGGGSQGTLERGSAGGKEAGSLFSNIGKKENSDNNEKANFYSNNNSTSGNNNTSSNNNNNSDKKQENEDGKSNKTNSSQNESNNSNSATSNFSLAGSALNQNNASIFNGKDGAKGEQGIKGSDGKEGSHGENGTTGEQGRTGDTGSSGVQGEKGENGDSKSIYNSNFSDVSTANTQTDNTENTSFKRNKDLDDEDK